MGEVSTSRSRTPGGTLGSFVVGTSPDLPPECEDPISAEELEGYIATASSFTLTNDWRDSRDRDAFTQRIRQYIFDEERSDEGEAVYMYRVSYNFILQRLINGTLRYTRVSTYEEGVREETGETYDVREEEEISDIQQRVERGMTSDLLTLKRVYQQRFQCGQEDMLYATRSILAILDEEYTALLSRREESPLDWLPVLQLHLAITPTILTMDVELSLRDVNDLVRDWQLLNEEFLQLLGGGVSPTARLETLGKYTERITDLYTKVRRILESTI